MKTCAFLDSSVFYSDRYKWVWLNLTEIVQPALTVALAVDSQHFHCASLQEFFFVFTSFRCCSGFRTVNPSSGQIQHRRRINIIYVPLLMFFCVDDCKKINLEVPKSFCCISTFLASSCISLAHLWEWIMNLKFKIKKKVNPGSGWCSETCCWC